MNREDLDACTASPACTASDHVLSCPSPRRAPRAESPPAVHNGRGCFWNCGIATPHRHAKFPGDLDDQVSYIGAWLAYYHDRSGMALFASEVEALRYAVEHSMQVTFWTFGTDWGEATGERRRPPRPPEMPPPLPDPVIPSS